MSGGRQDCAERSNGMISDGSLRKEEHLLKTKDFRALYKKGRSARRSGIVLYCLANGLEHNRIGFSIGSSAIRRATVRNRIRRCLREAYRRNKTGMKTAFDIVFVVRRRPDQIISYGWAEETLLAMLKQTGIL